MYEDLALFVSGEVVRSGNHHPRATGHCFRQLTVTVCTRYGPLTVHQTLHIAAPASSESNFSSGLALDPGYIHAKYIHGMYSGSRWDSQARNRGENGVRCPIEIAIQE